MCPFDTHYFLHFLLIRYTTYLFTLTFAVGPYSSEIELSLVNLQNRLWFFLWLSFLCYLALYQLEAILWSISVILVYDQQVLAPISTRRSVYFCYFLIFTEYIPNHYSPVFVHISIFLFYKSVKLSGGTV